MDKSDLIEELFPALGMDERFFCFTRPRRFGKSVMANMVGAFFENGVDVQEIFDKLKISQSGDYQKHLNKHNLIYIDMSRMPKNSQSYASYIDRIQDELSRDLAEAYPQFKLNSESAVWDSLQIVYSKTNDKFIFVLDAWDAIFYKDFITGNEKKSYLDFLRNLLKNQVYVELAYMTGVLPIAKYSSGSELNMFMEYDMATKMRFSEYFGFDDSEVDVLFETYRRAAGKCRITREDLAQWYDGYHTAGGERLYNPCSVVCALTNDQISNYWTSSGPYDEIFFYIRNNIDEIRDDIALMVSGEHIEIKLEGYSVTDTELRTKNQIYSAMVVYGLLTYDREADEVFIPNRELMERYKNLLMSNESHVDRGYSYYFLS